MTDDKPLPVFSTPPRDEATRRARMNARLRRLADPEGRDPTLEPSPGLEGPGFELEAGGPSLPAGAFVFAIAIVFWLAWGVLG